MTIIDIKGRSYEVHSVKPYFYVAGATGNAEEIQGETLVVRQVRSQKFWMVNRYPNGTYSKLIG